MVLSWSRREAIVWARSRDALSWQSCHTGCFARLGGVPAAVRVDNERTAVVRGAGAWGTINAAYRRYATVLRFHVDACAPRQPQAKGKVERRVRDQRRGDRPCWARASRTSQRCRPGPTAAGGAGARAALPGERDERGGGLGAGAGAADAAAGAAARAVRRRGDAAGRARRPGVLRRPAIQRAVPADWRDGRGAWRRRGGADPQGLRRSGAASTRDGAAAGASIRSTTTGRTRSGCSRHRRWGGWAVGCRSWPRRR